ncbi:hypothetical protein ACFV9C_12925 [Kribbella sp. NPDC059898]|uniref:hypothetical protein n=1 Tax=Kribbella sp. NPDC059898 TaxID=3346995 RepID=UPI0036627EF7
MARKAWGIAVGLLYVGMLVLLFKGPSYTIADYAAGPVHVRCGSVIAVGWPSDHSYLGTDGSSSWGDHVDGDVNVDAGRAAIARDCSERRDTYLALAILAAVAANLVTLGAFTVHRTVRAEAAPL